MSAQELSIADLITIDEAARELNVSRRQIQHYFTDGKLHRYGMATNSKRTFISKAEMESIKHRRFYRKDSQIEWIRD